MHSILVVDDEPALRELLATTLSEPGYTVHVAADGYEALCILVEHPVDLLLTDVVIPGISGFELARQAKLMRPQLHVIYTSAYYDRADDGDGPIYGDLLPKPLRTRDLLKAVRREFGDEAMSC